MIIKLVITKFGDKVIFPNVTDLESATEFGLARINGELGVHVICEGKVCAYRISQEYWALICSTCFLRAPFPSNTSSFRDLKKYFQLNLLGTTSA